MCPSMLGGQLAQQQLGADRRGAQLGVGQVKVVLPLHHVVGEVVAQRPAHPAGGAVVGDDVEPHHLRLLPAVEGEVRDAAAAAPRRPGSRRCPGRTTPAVRQRCPRLGFPRSTPHLNSFMLSESSLSAGVSLACMRSRASALPRWVKPVPVTQQRVGTGCSRGGSSRPSASAASRSTASLVGISAARSTMRRPVSMASSASS